MTYTIGISLYLGTAYKTPHSAKLFTHFIAENVRQGILESIAVNKFYSIMMDGSTDAGRVEQELMVILTVFRDDFNEEVKSVSRFFSISPLEAGNAKGLIKCASKSLSALGITDISSQNISEVTNHPILIGIGTDGASVNVGEVNGMKGMVHRANGWIFWSWCYAHRLELASKNAFSSTLCIEEMLLRLYYLYEKSPQKIRELEGIVCDLKDVFELPFGGNVPVRACGSRWITHKRNALLRVVDRYGAYINHLTTLTQDNSVKPDDKAKLKGYLKRWTAYKVLFGCALYADILKPVSILSLSLQNSDLDIVLGIKNIIKATATLKNLAKQKIEDWPTVKLVKSRIVQNDLDNEVTYQCAVMEISGSVKSVEERCTRDALSDLDTLSKKMKERLEWSDVKLLKSLLTFLETQSWIKRSAITPSTESDEDDDDHTDDPSLTEVKIAVEHISTHFRIPLDAKGFSAFALPDEIEEIVEYSRTYLSISHSLYKKVWYKLCTCPDNSKWPNVLIVMELCFSLPFSNGRVEQIFSTMKAIKTNRRTSLATSTLNDLLEIHVEGPPLSHYCPDGAIELWWKDTTTPRRLNQPASRKEYQPQSKSNAAEVSEQNSDSAASLSQKLN